MSDYDILLLRVEHQDAEIARLRKEAATSTAAFMRQCGDLDSLRAALEEIASASYQCGHGCADYARKALAKEVGK